MGEENRRIGRQQRRNWKARALFFKVRRLPHRRGASPQLRVPARASTRQGRWRRARHCAAQCPRPVWMMVRVLGALVGDARVPQPRGVRGVLRLEEAPAVVGHWRGREREEEETWGEQESSGGKEGLRRRGRPPLSSPPVADSADLTYLDSSSRLPAPPETMVVM
jgi:hypothetical protein